MTFITSTDTKAVALLNDTKHAGDQRDDKKQEDEDVKRARCCPCRRRCGAKNVEERKGGKCCRAKCAVCAAVALPIVIPVVIILSPILIARRLITGKPMCCKRSCKASSNATTGGQSTPDQAEEIKVDTLYAP